jgi:endo-1,4-beta-xylanase
MPGRAQSDPTLRSLASQLGFVIGAGANDPTELDDPTYASIAASQYNAIEPGNVMKMNVLEPSQGTFSFSQADAVVAFAQAHSQNVTATAPIWDGNPSLDYGGSDPTWLLNGSFTSTELENILQTYVTTVMQHYHTNYPGVVNRWAVVSEAVHLCRVFCKGLGNDSAGFPAYISLAYQYARAADPTVQLCYDDWGGEGISSTYSTSIYNLVAHLKSQGLIDCVGLEGQWEGGPISAIPTTSSIVSNINRLGALGLTVYFSQVEIGIPSSNCTTSSNSSDLSDQGVEYSSLLSACLSTSACTAFYTWGITDKYAYCFAQGYGAPLPYDLDYNPKPAFSALQSALSSGVSSAKPHPPTQLAVVTH